MDIAFLNLHPPTMLVLSVIYWAEGGMLTNAPTHHLLFFFFLFIFETRSPLAQASL